MHKLWDWYPPVGVFIAILGLLGVLVPLFREWGKISKLEKATWTFVMFVFVLLELKSIYQDRNAHDKEQAAARAEELRSFKEIANGIDTSIENSHKQFDATMTKAQENLNHMTGGNTYPMIGLIPIPIGNKPDTFRLALQAVGDSPLFDVSVSISKLPLPTVVSATDFVSTGKTVYDTVFTAPSLSPNRAEMLPPVTISLGSQSDFLITTIARNGVFHERLHVRKSGDIESYKGGLILPWEWAYEITRQKLGRDRRIHDVSVAKLKWQRPLLAHGQVKPQ
jgi:hypothetical protein